jgi:predicted enzyme related to lactoylglutathione lyase
VLSQGSRLAYLYVGSANIARDVEFYSERLGGEVAWRVEGMGGEVAAVRLGDGPLVLLADHRDAPSVVQIWAVDDLEAAERALKEAGWRGGAHRVEVPDGPCLVLKDPSANEIGLLQQTRPEVARHFAERST